MPFVNELDNEESCSWWRLERAHGRYHHDVVSIELLLPFACGPSNIIITLLESRMRITQGSRHLSLPKPAATKCSS